MLTPEQSEAILKKDLANIIAKSRDGKPLSAAERETLAAHTVPAPSTGDGVELIDAARLASVSGLSDFKLRQLAKAGHYPAQKGGRYEMDAALRGLFALYAAKGGGDEMRGHKSRLVKSQADAAEIKTEQLRGRTYDADEVAKMVSEMVTVARARLFAAPVKHAANFVGLETLGEAQRRLTTVTNEVALELAAMPAPNGSATAA